MKKVFSVLALGGWLAACTSSGGDEKVLLFECQEQFQGNACWKLGKKREGEEALRFFRMGCEKGSTDSCLSLSEKTPDKAEAERARKQACERPGSTACGKLEK